MNDDQDQPLTLDDVSDDDFLAALGALIAEGAITVEVEPVDGAVAPAADHPGASQDGA